MRKVGDDKVTLETIRHLSASTTSATLPFSPSPLFVPLSSMFLRQSCSSSRNLRGKSDLLSSNGLPRNRLHIREVSASPISALPAEGLHPEDMSPVTSPPVATNGDLNNTSALRDVKIIKADAAYSKRTLAIEEMEDDPEIRQKYRPFLLSQETRDTDWISQLELCTAFKARRGGLESEWVPFKDISVVWKSASTVSYYYAGRCSNEHRKMNRHNI